MGVFGGELGAEFDTEICINDTPPDDDFYVRATF